MAGRVGVRIARNAALTFGAGCVAAVAQAAGSIVAARVLGTEAYGRFGLLLWIVGLTSIAAALGLPITLTRFMADARRDGDEARTRRLLRRAVLVVAVVSAVAALLLALAAPLGARYFRDVNFVVPARVAALSIPAVSLGLLLRAALAGLDRYPALSRVTAWLAPIQLALLIAGLSTGLATTGALIAYAAAQVLSVVLLVRTLWISLSPDRAPASAVQRAGPSRFDVAVRHYARTALAIAILDAILWQRSEVFFLGRFSAPEELAHYSVAFGFSAMAMALVPGAFATVLLPIFSEIAGRDSSGAACEPDRTGRLYAASIRYLAMLALPIAAGGAALSGPIVRVLFGPPYEAAAAPLAIVFLGAAAGALGSAGSSLLYGAACHGVILRMGLLGAALNVVLDLTLIPRGGALGAAVANTIAQVVVVCAGIAYVKRRHARSAPLPFAAIGRIAAASAAMAAVLFPLASVVRGPATLALAVLCGAAIYVAILLFIRGVDSADIELARRIGERIPEGRGLRLYVACLDLVERAFGRGSPGGRT